MNNKHWFSMIPQLVLALALACRTTSGLADDVKKDPAQSEATKTSAEKNETDKKDPNKKDTDKKDTDKKDDKQPSKHFDVHDFGVWIAEPNAREVNARELYPNTLPSIVNSMRNRPLRGVTDLPPAPMGVMAFYGDAQAPLDVELRVTSGRFLSHWPPADVKSGRLRWFEASLVEKPNEKAHLPALPPEHWYAQARGLGTMMLERGARAEAFLAYDAELGQPGSLAIKLDGGPDKYTLTNYGHHALQDVVISVPTEKGRRIAWLDEAPGVAKTEAKKEEPKPAAAAAPKGNPMPVTVARQVIIRNGRQVVINGAQEATKEPTPSTPTGPGATTEVAMSEPLAADSEEFKTKTSGELRARLVKAGLNEKEADMILANFEQAVFGSKDLVVLYRLPQSVIDERLPLVVEPDPNKIVRVTLVLNRNADPAIRASIDELVKQLGDRDYTRREAAEQQLLDLGAMAFDALREAQKSKDPEVVFRSRRLLRSQDEKPGDEPAELGIGG